MSKIKSVKHNVIMNGILTVSKIIFPLITFPYVSRTLLVEANGRITFASSVITYFSMFAMLGINTYGVKACAKARDDRTKLSRVVQELLFINIICSIISLLVLGIAVFCVNRLNSEWILLLIFSSNIILNVAGMEWMYSGLEQYDYITIRSVAFKFLSMILMFLFVHTPRDCYIYAIIMVISTTGSNILNLVNARKYIIFKPVGNYNIKKHIKPTLTMFVTVLSVNVYMNLDNVMLGFAKSDYDVGIYHTAFKIKTVLTSLVTSIGTVLLPRLSYYVEDKNSERFYRLLRKSLSITLFLSVPMVTYFVLYAKECVLFIAGKAFSDAVVPMQIVMPILLITGLSNVIGMQILIPNNKESVFMKAVIVGALTDLVLNAILIPQYAAIGASIATLCAETVQFIIQLLYAKNIFREIICFKELGKVIISTLIAAIGCCWVGKVFSLGIFGTLCISAMIFGMLYLLIAWILNVKVVKELVPSKKR